MIDIRLPIGGLFSILGLMLIGYGIMTTGNEMYQRSLGININLWWGLAMLVFGGLMLFFGVKKSRAGKQANPEDQPRAGARH